MKSEDIPCRLAVLVPEYPGPSLTFVRRDIANLRRMGVQVDVFSTKFPRQIAPGWGKDAQAETTYLASLNASAFADLVRYAWRMSFARLFRHLRDERRTEIIEVALSVPFAAYLAAECRRRKVQHIHVHMPGRAALIGRLAAAAADLPYSITLHGELARFGANQRLKWERAAFGISVNEELAVDLRDKLAPVEVKQIVVQPMGVDSTWFAPARPYRPWRPGQRLRVFSCGRINRGKGHDILVEAISIVAQSGCDVMLEIAGGATLRQENVHDDLKAQIARLGLEQRIRLLDDQSEEQVREGLRSAHVFALASRYESVGIAYLEAMSCGVPTIATKVGGVPQVVEHRQSGLLVPPVDPRAIADAILEISRDPALAERLSVAGRAWATEHFPIDASSRRLAQLAFPERFGDG